MYVVDFVKIHLFNKFQENQCFSTLFFSYRFHKAWSTARQLLYFVSIQGVYVKSFSMAICSNLPQIYPHSSGGKNSLIQTYCTVWYHIHDHGQYKLGNTTSSFPTKIFKSWAVWQIEKYSIPAESQTSLQGATLKSCSHNINADMAPLL